MISRNTLQDRLDAARPLTEITITNLDEILAEPQSLELSLPDVLEALDGKPIRDDRVVESLTSARASSGLRHDSPFARCVDEMCRMSVEDEVRVAKRIDFARLRMEQTLARVRVPDDERVEYYDLVDTPTARRLDTDPEGARDDDGELHERLEEFLAQRNEMVEKNVPLVQRIALRYRTYGIPSGDLEQHGTIGLIRAADKFDWRRRVRFRTYAEWWIRQAIERATDTDRDVIHVPRPMRQKISRANHLNRLSGADRPLDANRFAELTGVDREAARHALTIKSGMKSLERSGPLDGLTLRDTLEGPDLGAAREREEIDHLRSRVSGLLSQLPPREATVLHMRFGLDGSEPRTLEEVGHELHISRERVRQLQVRALLHLRDSAADPRNARAG